MIDSELLILDEMVTGFSKFFLCFLSSITTLFVHGSTDMNFRTFVVAGTCDVQLQFLKRVNYG